MYYRKRGGLYRGIRAQMDHELFFQAAELVLAGIVLISLLAFVMQVKSEKLYEKNYASRDVALLISALYASPSDVSYTYAEQPQKLLFEFGPSKLSVFDAGMEDEVPSVYLYSTNAQIPFVSPLGKVLTPLQFTREDSSLAIKETTEGTLNSQ